MQASLDIGSSKVAVVIAQRTYLGELRTIGVGTGFHNGLHRGAVSDADAVVKAVMEAVIKAERMAQVPMPPAVVGVPGSLCSSFAARGTVAISRFGHRVQAEDIERALGAAEATAVPPGRRVVYRLVRAFRLDGLYLDEKPIGKAGRHLEVDVQFITAALPTLEELVQCLEQAGVEIGELMVQSLATSDVALLPSQRKLGVALVDLGAGLTDVVIFRNGRLQYTACVPIGTDNLARDLVIGMGISSLEAERLVRELGCSPAPDSSRHLEKDGLGDIVVEVRHLSQYREILMARAEEIWQLVKGQLEKAGGGSSLQAGVKMVGGGALVPGLADLGFTILGMPVDTTLPTEMEGLPEACRSPAYAAVVGLSRHRARRLSALSEAHAASKPASWNVLWQRVRDWLEF